jgi:sugar O-acyltransferase (sialic acid O-acetyltransferase NeuD family)
LTNKIAIIGAGSHTRSSINLLLTYFNGSDMSIYDDSFVEGTQEVINSIPLVGSVDDVSLKQSVFLSIGDGAERKRYFLKFKDQILKANIFHSSVLQEEGVIYGISNQFFAHSYINSQVAIGDNNIINTGAIIEHEAAVGSHNHISVGVKICGRSSIGDMCFIGAGAIIIDKLSICDNVTIGAGSVVIRDIKEAGTYVGNPAKKVK